MINIRSKYHVALNNIGLILQNAPTNPAYSVEQAPLYNNRFAQGDRTYDDFAKWWYWAQTDWFQGIKNDTSWDDDAKYYLSTNIDTFSEVGSIKLLKQPQLVNTFNEEIVCGIETPVSSPIIGTKFYADNDERGYLTGANDYYWTGFGTGILTEDDNDRCYCDNPKGAAYGVIWNFKDPSYPYSSFDIPSNAIITGIEFKVKAHTTIAGKKIYLGVGPNYNDPWNSDNWSSLAAEVALSTTEQEYTVGGQNFIPYMSINGGHILYPSQVNSPNFAVRFQGSKGAYINYIWLKIYYVLLPLEMAYYMGTEKNTSTNKPIVYKYVTPNWTDLSSSFITSTSRDQISQILNHSGVLWFLTTGSSETFAVNSYNGYTFTDYSYILNRNYFLPFRITSSRCGATVIDKLYLFVGNDNRGYAIIRANKDLPESNKDLPEASSDWSAIITRANSKDIPISAAEYGGSLYYLLSQGNQMELRMYDPEGDQDIHLYTFKNTSQKLYGVGNKYLINHNGLLIITVPPNEVWAFNGSTLGRIFELSEAKVNLGGDASINLVDGCVLSKGKLWWGNLMFDGTNFHNTFKGNSDSESYSVIPLFTDRNDVIFLTDYQDKRNYINTIIHLLFLKVLQIKIILS